MLTRQATIILLARAGELTESQQERLAEDIIITEMNSLLDVGKDEMNDMIDGFKNE